MQLRLEEAASAYVGAVASSLAARMGIRIAIVTDAPADQHQPRWAAADEARSILARMKAASEALAGLP